MATSLVQEIPNNLEMAKDMSQRVSLLYIFHMDTRGKNLRLLFMGLGVKFPTINYY